MREVARRRERWLNDLAQLEEHKKLKASSHAKQQTHVEREEESFHAGARLAEKKPQLEKVALRFFSTPHKSDPASAEPFLMQPYTCQICCEIMNSNTGRAPIKASPCGHSFCKGCLESRCNISCLVCGIMISSWVFDSALEQLVAAFLVAREERLERIQAPVNNQSSHDYSEKLSHLATRLSIIKRDLGEKESKKGAYDAQVSGFRRAQEALADEEKAALDRLDRAKRHLELVKSHIRDQENQQAEAQRRSDDLRNQIGIANQSLTYLEQEYDKIQVLLAGSMITK